jgi:hypothetical protein
MVINSNGNVGIGTAGPISLLHVNGQSRFEDNIRVKNNEPLMWLTVGGSDRSMLKLTSGDILQVGESAGDSNDAIQFKITGYDNAMYIDSSGNVGIGTTSPGQKLDVNGNINVSASEGTIHLGADAMIKRSGNDVVISD